MVLVACNTTPKHSTNGGVDFPYGPATYQIHLLSRLENNSDGMVSSGIVCVEFDDRDNQATRATGLLEITIKISGQASVERAFDLSDLKINESVWNRTTRMYQVNIPFNPVLANAPIGGIPISVTWTPVDGKPIMENGVLRALNPK